MIKNVLKFIFIALVFISVLMVPIFGVSFYDSPSVFEENAVLTDRQLGGGTSVYLAFTSEEDGNVTAEDYEIAAKIIEERFVAMSYSDADAKAADQQVLVNISQKTYIDTIVTELCKAGEWSFVGSNMNDSLCDASMIESAEVAANTSGGYSVSLSFTEDGVKKFNTNTAAYTISSSSFYLMIDGQLMAVASVPAGGVDKTFLFGNFQDYQPAAMIAAIMDNGALPSDMEIAKTEPLAPSMNEGLRIAVYSICAVLVLACVVVLIIKGKASGIFAAAAIIANGAVMATALANGSFMLNLATLLEMAVLAVLSTVLFLFAIQCKAKGGMSLLNKFNTKVILIHGLVFLAALILWIFPLGVISFMTKALIVYTVSNFVFYYLFYYFATHALSTKNN